MKGPKVIFAEVKFVDADRRLSVICRADEKKKVIRLLSDGGVKKIAVKMLRSSGRA